MRSNSRVVILAGADPGSDLVVALDDAGVAVIHTVVILDEREVEELAVLADRVAGLVPEHVGAAADVLAVLFGRHREAVLCVVTVNR